MKDHFTLRCGALPGSIRVVGFRGREALSTPYAIDIFFTVAADDSDFDLGGAVGARASLVVASEPPFPFHGILSTVELAHQYPGYTLFRATLVPALWQLSLSRHSRVFTDMSIPDILRAVLEGAGVSDLELRLAGGYAAEEHVCQYRESDLDFVSRWMEHEGMYYFFEQGEAKETLIITDSLSFQAPSRGPVRYAALAEGDRSSGEAIDTLVCRHSALPGKVRLTDYDYTRPTLDVSGEAPVSTRGVFGQVNDYGARFFTPARGRQLAQIRAEELRAGQVIVLGSGTALRLRSGYFFELEEHPRAALNAKYLATEIEHVGNQTAGSASLRHKLGLETDDAYRMELTAIPANVQFRPVRATAWPRIYGYENGVVDGPAASQYAQLDEHGRYNVSFKFDERSKLNGTASTWVRMAQTHGGNPETMHFPLRKGTEVILSFLGGDPDRPVIAGVVPDAHRPSPVTSTHPSLNVLQTGGRNRFELEDLAGLQHVTLTTPYDNTMLHMGAPRAGHNAILTTDGSALLNTGQNWDVTVAANLTENVTGNTTEEYVGTRATTVVGAATESWSSTLTSKVTGTTSQTYVGAQTIASQATRTDDVTGNLTETYHANVTRTTLGTLTEAVNGAVTGTYGPTTVTVNGPRTETVTGPVTQTFGPLTTTVNGPTTLTSAGPYTVNAPNVHVTSAAEYKTAPYYAEAVGAKAGAYGTTGVLSGMSVSVVGKAVTVVVSDIKWATWTSVVSVLKYDVGIVKIDSAFVRHSQTVTDIKMGTTLMHVLGIAMFL